MNGAPVRLASVAIIAAATWTAPAAAAVTPPTVDGARLPPPRAPMRQGPTEQTGPCPNTTHGPEPAVVPANSVELQSVWPLTRGAGQTVAVIDTGVAPHRLLPHLFPGGDYVSTGDGTQDCDGHGTIVAGIIGATPVDVSGATFGGVAPDAGIVSIRQSSNVFRLSDSTSGPGVGDVDTLAMAVRTAADEGATVINISSVACVSAPADIADEALGAALAYAVDSKNVVVVAAAGNVGGAGQCPEQNPFQDPARAAQPNWDSVKVVASPAWYDDYVLTVGSVDAQGRPSHFTLAGPWVDVAARGEDIVSLDPGGDGVIDEIPGSAGPMPISGTSYAAPVVSGLAALVRAASPRLTARQVMRRIEDTAHHPGAGWDPLVGHGVVDLLAAVSADGVRVSGPTMPPPTASAPAPENRPGSESRRFALFGAAICIAAVIAAMTLSTNMLRRHRPSVAED